MRVPVLDLASARASNVGGTLAERSGSPLLLLARQRQVLIRGRTGVARDQPEPGFPHPEADAVEEGHLPKMREDRA